MKEIYCESCKYFIQHYIKLSCGYSTADCGHCCYALKIKRRKPQDTACCNYNKKSYIQH